MKETRKGCSETQHETSHPTMDGKDHLISLPVEGNNTFLYKFVTFFEDEDGEDDDSDAYHCFTLLLSILPFCDGIRLRRVSHMRLSLYPLFNPLMFDSLQVDLMLKQEILLWRRFSFRVHSQRSSLYYVDVENKRKNEKADSQMKYKPKWKWLMRQKERKILLTSRY